MRKLIASIALAIAQVEAREGKCYGLVMSGGSNNGAWEAGVIWGLVNYGNPADFQWDVVTGVSAGAINTCAAAVFPKGEEVAYAQFLSDTFNSITTDDIWIERPGGKLGEAEAVFTEPSILNDAPVVPTMQGILAPFASTGIQRAFTVGSVDANTGDYLTFTHLNTDFADLAQACVCSASIPGMFIPQHYKGHVMMDGGTMWDINIDSAVNYCLEQGFTEDQVVIDALNCWQKGGIDQTISGDAFHNFQDGRKLKQQYQTLNAIQAELKAYPAIEMRYYFAEWGSGCPPHSSLDFTPEVTMCLQDSGRRQAAYMLGLGKVNTREVLSEWLNDKQARIDFPDFQEFLAMKAELIQ